MPEQMDSRIRSMVVELAFASPEPPTWSAVQNTFLSDSSKPRRRPVPAWAVAVAAAVVLILAVAIPAFLLGGGESSPVEPEPTTTTIDATTTTIDAAPPSLLPVGAWSRVGAEVMDPAVGLFAISETSYGLVAVGFDPGEDDFRQNGVVLRTDDGVEWERLGEDHPALNLGAILMYGVTEYPVADGGPGIIAVGMGCENDEEPCRAYPTIWTSADGDDWTRSPEGLVGADEWGAIMDVIVTDHGVVAGGGISAETDDGYVTRPAIWLSDDGLEWESVWAGAPIAEGDQMRGVVSLAQGPDGLVVAAGLTQTPDGDPAAGVWVSTDARTWERVDDADLVSRDGTETSILDIAYGERGFVGVGNAGGREAAIWHSSDGHAWTRIDTVEQPFGGTGSLASVNAIAGGYLATGDHGFASIQAGAVRVWTSPNGITWNRIADLGEGYTTSVAVRDSVIAIAGGLPHSNDFHASVWTGPIPVPGTPGPDPVSAEAEAEADLVVRAPLISGIAAGVSCGELAEQGFRYPQVVAYWHRHGQPDMEGSASNGVPCAKTYPASDIEAVYGPEDGLAVDLTSVIDDRREFSVEGAAVDAGLMCSTGTSAFLDNEGANSLGALWEWRDELICGDGSGSFVIAASVYVNADGSEYGTWWIAEGTGAYTSLAGGGHHLSSSHPTLDAWYDSLQGRLWLTKNED